MNRIISLNLCTSFIFIIICSSFTFAGDLPYNVEDEAEKKLIDENPDLVIIDVSPNYNDGHIPGAISYYIGDGSLEKAIPTLDPNGKYLVYCHVDRVAIAGAQALIDAGFKNVYRLEGNYSAWVAAGYPVEK